MPATRARLVPAVLFSNAIFKTVWAVVVTCVSSDEVLSAGSDGACDGDHLLSSLFRLSAEAAGRRRSHASTILRTSPLGERFGLVSRYALGL